jgi:hypothetical protein
MYSKREVHEASIQILAKYKTGKNKLLRLLNLQDRWEIEGRMVENGTKMGG